MSHDDGSCATAAMSGCDVVPDIKQGDRTAKFDQGSAVFVAVDNAASNFDYVRSYVSPFLRESLRPTYSGGPPINLKNCVFLK